MPSVKAILKAAWTGWQRHNLTQHAAALAYSALFAMAPILLLLMVVATIALGRQSADGELYARISDVAGAAAANEALHIAHGTAQRSGVLSVVIGVVLALAGGLGMTLQFESAIDTIWEDTARTMGGFWPQVRQRLIAAIALIAIVAGFLALAIADVALSRFNLRFGPFVHAFVLVGVAGCVLAFFTIVYRTVPQTRPRWKEAFIAAAVTTGLVVVGQVGFAAYLHYANIGNAYGDAGSVIVLLVWLYYSSLAALAGAELARAVEGRV
jgi:membrane protein